MNKKVWGVPLLLTLCIAVGLLSALLGQGGGWYWLSWIAMLTPLAVLVRKLTQRTISK
jgi:hypothetical protein